MNESVSRLIEAERRIARSESELRNLSTKLAGVRQDLRNRSQSPINQIRTVTGGGGDGMHRFAVEYEAWVEWDTVPTLKTGASSNPTADVTSLATAVSSLEEGFTLDIDTLNDSSSFYWHDHAKASMIAGVDYRFESADSVPWSAFTRFAKWDTSGFIADPKITGSGPAIDETSYGSESSSSSVYRLLLNWNRRNGIGTVIGTDTLTARRTLSSEDEFGYGPTYGDSGTWSFEMECPATTYHNAGSGTIFLRWGTTVPSIVSGGTPDSLPTDIIDGGGPGSLPTDIIDGGTI